MHHGYAPLRKSCCATPTTCVYLRSRVYKEPDRLASLDLYIFQIVEVGKLLSPNRIFNQRPAVACYPDKEMQSFLITGFQCRNNAEKHR